MWPLADDYLLQLKAFSLVSTFGMERSHVKLNLAFLCCHLVAKNKTSRRLTMNGFVPATHVAGEGVVVAGLC